MRIVRPESGAVNAAKQVNAGPVRLPVWRARFVVSALLVAFAVLAGRSLYLQTLRTDFLQGKGDARYSRVIEVPATRGRILDRNGDAARGVDAGEIDLGDSGRRRVRAGPEEASSPRCSASRPKEIDKKLADPSRDFVYLKRQVSPGDRRRGRRARLEGASISSASTGATTPAAK